MDSSDDSAVSPAAMLSSMHTLRADVLEERKALVLLEREALQENRKLQDEQVVIIDNLVHEVLQLRGRLSNEKAQHSAVQASYKQLKARYDQDAAAANATASSDLRVELAELRAQLEAERTANSHLTSDLSRTATDRDFLMRSLGELEHTQSQLSSLLQSADARLAESEHRREVAEASSATLHDAHSAAMLRGEQLLVEVASLNSEKAGLHAQLEAAIIAANRAQDALEQQHIAVTALAQDREHALGQLAGKLREAAEERTSASLLGAQLDELRGAYTAEVEAVRTQSDFSRQQQEAALSHTRQQLDDATAQLQAARSELESERAGAQAQLAECQLRIRALETEVTTQQAAVTEHAATVGAVRATLAEVVAARDALSVATASAEARASAAEGRVASLLTQLASLGAKMEDKFAERGKALTAADHAASQIQLLNTELDARTRQLDDAHRSVQQLQSDLNYAVEQAAVLTAELAARTVEVDSARAQVDSQHAHSALLEASLVAAREELQAQQAAAQRHQVQTEVVTHRLQTRLTEMQLARDAAVEQVQAATALAHDLRRRLGAKDGEMEAVRHEASGAIRDAQRVFAVWSQQVAEGHFASMEVAHTRLDALQSQVSHACRTADAACGSIAHLLNQLREAEARSLASESQQSALQAALSAALAEGSRALALLRASDHRVALLGAELELRPPHAATRSPAPSTATRAGVSASSSANEPSPPGIRQWHNGAAADVGTVTPPQPSRAPSASRGTSLITASVSCTDRTPSRMAVSRGTDTPRIMMVASTSTSDLETAASGAARQPQAVECASLPGTVVPSVKSYAVETQTEVSALVSAPKGEGRGTAEWEGKMGGLFEAEVPTLVQPSADAERVAALERLAAAQGDTIAHLEREMNMHSQLRAALLESEEALQEQLRGAHSAQEQRVADLQAAQASVRQLQTQVRHAEAALREERSRATVTPLAVNVQAVATQTESGDEVATVEDGGDVAQLQLTIQALARQLQSATALEEQEVSARTHLGAQVDAMEHALFQAQVDFEAEAGAWRQREAGLTTQVRTLQHALEQTLEAVDRSEARILALSTDLVAAYEASAGHSALQSREVSQLTGELDAALAECNESAERVYALEATVRQQEEEVAVLHAALLQARTSNASSVKLHHVATTQTPDAPVHAVGVAAGTQTEEAYQYLTRTSAGVSASTQTPSPSPTMAGTRDAVSGSGLGAVQLAASVLPYEVPSVVPSGPSASSIAVAAGSSASHVPSPYTPTDLSNNSQTIASVSKPLSPLDVTEASASSPRASREGTPERDAVGALRRKLSAQTKALIASHNREMERDVKLEQLTKLAAQQQAALDTLSSHLRDMAPKATITSTPHAAAGGPEWRASGEGGVVHASPADPVTYRTPGSGPGAYEYLKTRDVVESHPSAVSNNNNRGQRSVTKPLYFEALAWPHTDATEAAKGSCNSASGVASSTAPVITTSSGQRSCEAALEHADDDGVKVSVFHQRVARTPEKKESKRRTKSRTSTSQATAASGSSRDAHTSAHHRSSHTTSSADPVHFSPYHKGQEIVLRDVPGPGQSVRLIARCEIYPSSDDPGYSISHAVM